MILFFYAIQILLLTYLLTYLKTVPEMTYNVFTGTLNVAQSIHASERIVVVLIVPVSVLVDDDNTYGGADDELSRATQRRAVAIHPPQLMRLFQSLLRC